MVSYSVMLYCINIPPPENENFLSTLFAFPLPIWGFHNFPFLFPPLYFLYACVPAVEDKEEMPFQNLPTRTKSNSKAKD